MNVLEFVSDLVDIVGVKGRAFKHIYPEKERLYPCSTKTRDFWWSTDILLIINPSTGMDQEIHPCGQGRVNCVKINPSLLRMRESGNPHSQHLY